MEPIPAAILTATNVKSARLRELVRAPEILVMPGAYDVLSALLFQQLGFQAIQGTSGGIAAALGYPDGEVMSREQFIELSGNFAAAVSVPFNADGERGYGDENGVRDTVRALVARGVAGMNLEDGAAEGQGRVGRAISATAQNQSGHGNQARARQRIFSQRAGRLFPRHARRSEEGARRSDSSRQRLRRSGRRLHLLPVPSFGGNDRRV